MFPHFATDAIHAAQPYDVHTGAVITPLSLSTTYAQVSPGVPFPGHYEYTRTGSPTRDAFEGCLAALEGVPYCSAFSSGVSAAVTLVHTLQAGDHVLCIDDVYGGSRRYFTLCSKFEVDFSYCSLDTPEDVKGGITERTKWIWIESPTNPTMKLTDIAMVSRVAHELGVRVCVDNTFMSPYYQRPLSLGADAVMHSISKFINGHSDVIGGALITADEELHKQFKYLQNALGAILSPFDSYMALRGVKTLALRMKQHSINAAAVASFLESHEKVSKVRYPGLPSHPQHQLALQQMTGFGGMITFWIRGGLSQARTFLETLKLFALAESLGGVESLAEHPAIMTHASVPADQRVLLGIDDSLIRLSVGIEDEADLLQDVSDALDAVRL